MYVSLSKSQTKVSQPTTLRDLFKDGLQTIPALQDLTALVDKNPPVSDAVIRNGVQLG